VRRIAARGTLAVLCAIFFALGLLVAGLGPSLRALAQNTACSLAEVGGLYSALFAGSLSAQMIAGPLNDRMDQRPIVLAGLLLLACGMLGITVSWSLPVLLGSAAVFGLGHGTLIVTEHVLIARLFAERSTSALNLLNVFFGIGAVLGPAAAGGMMRVWHTALPVLWVGVGALVLLSPWVPLLTVVNQAEVTQGGRPSDAKVYRAPALWATAFLLLVYIGMESSVGGWTTTYIERTTGIATGSAALVTSGFWMALTGGRALGALVGTRLAPATLLMVSLAGAVAGGVLLVSSTGSLAGSIAAILLLGLCFGPVFPTSLALITMVFRRASGTAASIVVAVGNFGGVVTPWLLGVLLEREGPLASALLICGNTVLMLLLLLGYRLHRRLRLDPAAEGS
jgi:MFS transporter, FHS family, L-fucose permease